MANGCYGSVIDFFGGGTSSATDFFRHGADSTCDFFGWVTYSSAAIDGIRHDVFNDIYFYGWATYCSSIDIANWANDISSSSIGHGVKVMVIGFQYGGWEMPTKMAASSNSQEAPGSCSGAWRCSKTGSVGLRCAAPAGMLQVVSDAASRAAAGQHPRSLHNYAGAAPPATDRPLSRRGWPAHRCPLAADNVLRSSPIDPSLTRTFDPLSLQLFANHMSNENLGFVDKKQRSRLTRGASRPERTVRKERKYDRDQDAPSPSGYVDLRAEHASGYRTRGPHRSGIPFRLLKTYSPAVWFQQALRKWKLLAQLYENLELCSQRMCGRWEDISTPRGGRARADWKIGFEAILGDCVLSCVFVNQGCACKSRWDDSPEPYISLRSAARPRGGCVPAKQTGSYSSPTPPPLLAVTVRQPLPTICPISTSDSCHHPPFLSQHLLNIFYIPTVLSSILHNPPCERGNYALASRADSRTESSREFGKPAGRMFFQRPTALLCIPPMTVNFGIFPGIVLWPLPYPSPPPPPLTKPTACTYQPHPPLVTSSVYSQLDCVGGGIGNNLSARPVPRRWRGVVPFFCVCVLARLVDRQELVDFYGERPAKALLPGYSCASCKQRGAAVAQWLACPPPTKANMVQSPAWPPRIFACGNRAGRCRLWAGFLGDLPFPPPLHSSTAPYSPRFTLIGSQDHDVKSRQNFITHSRIQTANKTINGVSNVGHADPAFLVVTGVVQAKRGGPAMRARPPLSPSLTACDLTGLAELYGPLTSGTTIHAQYNELHSEGCVGILLANCQRLLEAHLDIHSEGVF
ncbi:hypothetical protein PR048_006231 [Dryococelus australis]|uniref:Uncharacterized protein n=1 Tax=Dryococelus australis TaxID=614101 RepID=A0ABQ9IBD0_9NEOP|nr:hypothetical protein PR048_006231 [Dryococelus australis]